MSTCYEEDCPHFDSLNWFCWKYWTSINMYSFVCEWYEETYGEETYWEE